MQLCDYGCGQEAKYQFKNGWWCCSKSYNQCPENRRKNSIGNLGKKYKRDKPKQIVNPDKILCSYGCGKIAKYQFKNGRWCCSPHYSSCEVNRKKLLGSGNHFFNKKHTTETKSILRKAALTQEYLPGRPKLSINELKQKYPFFLEVEEVHENKETKNIEVRCKYFKCENSKENDGWFIPTYIQLYERIRNLERGKGTGDFMYCSDICKVECPCYRITTDPIILSKYLQYHREVQKYTYVSVKNYSNKIKNIELRGNLYGYQLDHKFSIIDGFNSNVEPKLIGYWKNLEILTKEKNREKWMNSSITLEELKGYV